jgi:DNA polymerase (family 10)
MPSSENLSRQARGAEALAPAGQSGPDQAAPTPCNQEIASILDRVADLLDAQEANPFRVRAYRRGAEAVRELAAPVAALVAQGEDAAQAALTRIPDIGPALAAAVREIAQTGRLRLLDRLEGELAHGDLFATVPGIGAELAHRIHETLGIETLEELEAVAHDGRLARVPGIGPRRIRAVCAYLDAALSRSTRRRSFARNPAQLRFGFAEPAPRPSVPMLLALDETYRRLAEVDRLPRIAPRRFNPEHRAWLPVWHTERGPWSFTVLYSNTARAHELGRTHDWVVIYYEKDGREDQCTVVTEHQGELTGQRVIRGRERECARYYEQQDVPGEVRTWAHVLAESA